MRRQTLALAGASAALALAGCAHNDVLVFGTHTQLALDVQSASVQGGSPAITVGYKRTEAVWMPLVVNGKDSSVVGPCTKDPASGKCRAPVGDEWVPEAAKYQSREVIEPTDGKPKVTRSDAYSVFASLGATFNTSAGSSDQAQGGIAQFFATGNAATSIAENPALVTALKVESGQGAEAQAKAVQAAAAATAGPAAFDALLKKDLTPEQIAADNSAVLSHQAKQAQNLLAVVTCARDPATKAWRWPDIVDQMAVTDGEKKVLKDKVADESALIARLDHQDEWTSAALDAGKKKFSCT